MEVNLNRLLLNALTFFPLTKKISSRDTALRSDMLMSLNVELWVPRLHIYRRGVGTNWGWKRTYATSHAYETPALEVLNPMTLCHMLSLRHAIEMVT